MTSIATCPQCAAQLSVPESAMPGDFAQCPECRAEFALADADQRWLASATIVEPKAPEPTAAEEEPPAIEPPSPLPSSLEELTPDARNAETLISTSALSGWEERLRTAIDTPGETEEEPVPAADTPSEPSPLESSPEFEFHMDPPTESPAAPETPAAAEISETVEWLENASTPEVSTELPEEVSTWEPVAEEVVTESAAVAESELQAEQTDTERPRRKKNSLLRLAIVVVLFGAVGTLLGQYALLWMWGPSADYMGLVQVLPYSVLPPPTSQLLAPQISDDQLLAGTQPESGQDLSTDTARDLATAQPPENKPNDGATVDDSAVRPAGVELPVDDSAKRRELLSSVDTSPEEFSGLLSAAQLAAKEMVAGDLNEEGVLSRKAQAYKALCQLATHWSPAGADEQSAAALYRSLASDPAGREAVAHVGQLWLRFEQRPFSGCFLLGRIEETTREGDLTLYRLLLDGADGQTLTLVALDSGYQVGDSVGVVGIIVDQAQRTELGLPPEVQLPVAVRHSFSL